MNSTDLEKWREAAAIAAHTRDYVASMMEPGRKVIDLALAGHKRLEELGGTAAFPLQISRNHIAAHYCPFIGDPTVLEEGDVVKVDCGVHIDGFVADTAVTVDLSADGRHEPLLAASRAALEKAIEVAGPGVEVVEIGREVERVIKGRGFEPVRNLTGHGVGRYIIHRAPQIPNVPVGRGTLKSGTCVAIEPFATTGSGVVHEAGDPHVFMAKPNSKKIRGTDAQVLQAVRDFGGLPFGSRDLVQRFPYATVAETLNSMARANQLVVFPPLVEKKGTLVAQFEHTLRIHDDGVEVLTTGREPSRLGAVT